MKTILDACTVINLIKGGALETVLALEARSFAIGPIVLDECGDDRDRLARLVNSAVLEILDDGSVPSSRYLELLDRHGLGPGETECLAFAQAIECDICCDDRAARRVVTALFGRERLSGSIGLLRESVRSGLLTEAEAIAAYEQMRALGAFLPDIGDEFFSQ